MSKKLTILTTALILLTAGTLSYGGFTADYDAAWPASPVLQVLSNTQDGLVLNLNGGGGDYYGLQTFKMPSNATIDKVYFEYSPMAHPPAIPHIP